MPASSAGNGGNTTGERLASLETEMKHLATKKDIETLRTEIQKINTSIAQRETDLLKWGLARIIVAMSALIAAIALIVRYIPAS